MLMISVYLTGGGVDYDSGPFDITFPAGETLAVFNVSINDDDIVEGNENFTLSINTSSLPDTVANPVQITVTIVDDDCKYSVSMKHKNIILMNSIGNLRT